MNNQEFKSLLLCYKNNFIIYFFRQEEEEELDLPLPVMFFCIHHNYSQLQPFFFVK